MAITTRETTATGVTNKGAPLTNAEVDTNFIELQQEKIENVVEDTTPQLGGDLDLNGNDITGTGGVNITGSIALSGTVDGRDIATDGTKLDGIEASADVTDTANVTSAGALMDSEVTNLAEVKAFNSSDYATSAQGAVADSALQNVVEDTTPQLGGDLDLNSNNITGTGGVNITGNIVLTGTVDGRDVLADGTKLDGIEASADVTDAANVTAAGALMDSEVTNLAQVKAFDSSAYATAAQGTTADSALQNVVEDTTPQLGGNLDFNGNLATSFTSTGIDDNATSTAITIDASENVGIGVSSGLINTLNFPNAASIGFQDTGGSFRNALQLNASNELQIGAAGAGIASITLGPNGSEWMTLNSSGNVGIGKVPTAALDVDAGSNAALARFETSSTSLARAYLYGGAASTQTDVAFFQGTSLQGVVGVAPTTGNLFLDSRSSAGGDIEFQKTGSTKMRITSAGNVGIGITPATILNTNVASGNNEFRQNVGGTPVGQLISSTTNQYFVNLGSGVQSFWTNGAERMQVDSSGNVGIGTGSPTRRLYVKSDQQIVQTFESTAANSYISFVNATTAENRTRIGLKGEDTLVFRNGASDRMRINSTGDVSVGTTDASPGYGNSVVGCALSAGGIVHGSASAAPSGTFNRNGTGNVVVFYNSGTTAGRVNISGSTSVQYITSSDARLKENIVDAPAGNIDAIRVRSFDWSTDGTHQTYGMIAQELAEVAPEAVSQGETEEDMWGVDYSKLVPMMIKEIQDLKAEVAALKGAN